MTEIQKGRALLEMPLLSETAPVTHRRDQRTDALRILAEAKAKMEMEAGANPLFGDAVMEALRALADAQERLSTWCPQLFGPDAPRFDETCTCWRCSYDAPFSDPFEGQDEPG